MHKAIVISLWPPVLVSVASLAWVFGVSAFYGGNNPWVFVALMVLGYLVVVVALFKSIVGFQDWLNPLSLLTAIWLVRFCLPSLILLFRDPDLELFSTMGVGREDNWLSAHALALMGLLAVVVGWHLIPRGGGIGTGRRMQSLPSGVVVVALLSALVGFAGLFLFVKTNVGSFGAAIISGEFRGAEIQGGTGKYFFVSLLLIPSSVILSGVLANKGHFRSTVIVLPVVAAMLFFLVLGGRTRALTPFVAGCLVIWCWKMNGRFSSKVVLQLLIGSVLLVMFYFLGALYRHGLGLSAVAKIFSIETFLEYIGPAFWLEIGQLHALAGSVLIGPGVLGGVSFTSLLWPLSVLFEIPGRSSGIYIAETLVGFSGRKWGVHPTLVGDAYLNFGLAGVFLILVLFGCLLKVLYTRYRKGQLSIIVYVLTLVYSLRIFFESIDKYGEMVIVVGSAALIVAFGKWLSVVGGGGKYQIAISSNRKYLGV